MLFKALVDRLQSKPARAAMLLPWIRGVLLAHSSYLAAAPGIDAYMAQLQRLAEARTAMLPPLLALRGRLDFVLAQAQAGADASRIAIPMVRLLWPLHGLQYDVMHVCDASWGGRECWHATCKWHGITASLVSENARCGKQNRQQQPRRTNHVPLHSSEKHVGTCNAIAGERGCIEVEGQAIGTNPRGQGRRQRL